jgi:hypothetical protein
LTKKLTFKKTMGLAAASLWAAFLLEWKLEGEKGNDD